MHGDGRRSYCWVFAPMSYWRGHAELTIQSIYPYPQRGSMIPRYARPAMTKIWDADNKFQIWFEIEAHACDAQAKLGVIPESAAKMVWDKGKWDIAQIDEIEKETKHDVISFLTNLAEYVGPDARFVHQGMTSSDVLDTCFSVQLVQASALLLKDIENA